MIIYISIWGGKDNMPGYIIHLVEADMIMNKLIEKKNMQDLDFDQWKNMVYYGSLLPDVAGKMKEESHFWNKGEDNKIVRVPNLETFYHLFSNRLSEPITLGYLIHLHLDNRFFGDFFSNQFSFLDEYGQKTDNINVVKDVLIKISGKIVDVKRFFSDEYLYGDYTKLNLYLINKYQLKVPEYPANPPAYELGTVRFSDLEKILNTKLNEFILDSGTMKCEKLNVFSENGKNLETFLDVAAEEFIQLFEESII